MMKLADDNKKGITVKVDAKLHAEVRQYIEEHGMTMADFVSLALQAELHPKNQMKVEEKNMGNMRTLAFQVPEELFQRIKDYLQRNNMTQKEFVLGLIETELDRDLAMREATGAVQGAPSEQDEVTDEQEAATAVGDDVSESEEPAFCEEDEEIAEQAEDEESSMTMDFSMGM